MRKIQKKNDINIVVSARSDKSVARKKIEQHLSENMRQSFAAEGVYFSPEKWKKLEMRIKKASSSNKGNSIVTRIKTK